MVSIESGVLMSKCSLKPKNHPVVLRPPLASPRKTSRQQNKAMVDSVLRGSSVCVVQVDTESGHA